MGRKKIEKSEREWRVELTPKQFAVLRRKDTEHPFTGELLNEKGEGKYTCAACGFALFDSKDKYDSGTGWPSFSSEKRGAEIIKKQEAGASQERIEILCPQCGGHLGHVFEDGPAPTGVRYCVNSAALCFIKNHGREEKEPDGSRK